MSKLETLGKQLLHRFEDRMVPSSGLSRSMVSFQGNKGEPGYGWYRYKEAYSHTLVKEMLGEYGVSGQLLDPFSGSGTSLFSASSLGLDSVGIEVLPIGQFLTSARMVLSKGGPSVGFSLGRWLSSAPWEEEKTVAVPEVRITKGAYPKETEVSIGKYLAACRRESPGAQQALLLVLLSVLERVSYTRKDGQFLRWDSRSGRGKFYKGSIPSFSEAIREKLYEIGQGLPKLVDGKGTIKLIPGSCLYELPMLPGASFGSVFTSPPYCNRYDYTRTYALELAMLGVNDAGIAKLRQEMLSCTVENREKELLLINPAWSVPVGVSDEQGLLQEILVVLEEKRKAGELNNRGIPRMVRGYFYEMACVVYECARVLDHGARLFMVNDNVRYSGVDIPVDLILSSIAEGVGFEVDRILVLPSGKGNSSQQMGKHGRREMRKCVYAWKKIG